MTTWTQPPSRIGDKIFVQDVRALKDAYGAQERSRIVVAAFSHHVEPRQAARTKEGVLHMPVCRSGALRTWDIERGHAA